MRNSEPQTVNHLFKEPSLLTIQERSQVLSALNHLVHQFLPNTLNEYCRVANYRQNVLIIEVASASWLTRLRYEQEKLISQLRQHSLIGLASIQYKVNPELNKDKYILQSDEMFFPKRQITTQSASLLLSLAENTTPKLKTSLIKLANYATKIDNRER